MKRIISTLAFGAILLMGVNLHAQDNVVPDMPMGYCGIGPVIAGSVDISRVPRKAQDFLKHHFKEYAVVQCEKEFDDNTYELELSNGIDVEFDAGGDWREVEAGRSRVLAPNVVKKLVPDKTYKELLSRNVASRVESVKRYSDGYKVEIKNAKYDDYRFARDGKLISVSD